MAPTKGKKRAYSHDPIEDSGLDDIGQDNTGSFRPAANKKSRGSDWSSWQEGVRSEEADRVRQFLSTFQKDIVAGAREKALASLSRGEEANLATRIKKDKKILDSIREVYDTASTGASMGVTDHQLHVAGREVLALFHATLARYEQANTALEQALRGGTNENDKTADAVQASWEKDREEVSKLLRYGRVYGDSLVREIIVPKTASVTPTAGGGKGYAVNSKSDTFLGNGLNKTGRTALGMFPKSRATVDRGQTWGEAAKSQVQAIKGLLETLPSIGSHRHGESTSNKSVTFDC